MNTNEQQWQECPLEEATHAKTATGKVYKLDDRKEIIINRETILGSSFITPREFPELGITPVRKAEVKPVEFTARAKTVGNRIGGDMTIIEVPAEYAGKTFKFVEVTK